MKQPSQQLKTGMLVWRCSINYKKQKRRERVEVLNLKDGFVWTDDGLRYSEKDLKLNLPGDKVMAAGFYSLYWLEV